jgi:UDP-N-acetylglucosamine 2-epimerase (non-hydrolysing)
VADDRVRLVGNVMIDTLQSYLPVARARQAAAKLQLKPRSYGFVTLHRPSNVDDPETLTRLVRLLHRLADRLPLVFAVHPRTRAAAERCGIGELLAPGQSRLICTGPQPYLESLSLVAEAAVVLTDSGGLQEETSVLGVPCLTLRENTERPVTVTEGTSRLVGNDEEKIESSFGEIVAGRWQQGHPIPLWDGHAGERVAAELARWLGAPAPAELAAASSARS